MTRFRSELGADNITPEMQALDDERERAAADGLAICNGWGAQNLAELKAKLESLNNDVESVQELHDRYDELTEKLADMGAGPVL